MNMKHISLFEAFGSPALSKTINFLKKKFSNESSKLFVDKLKGLMAIYDLPINKIDENTLEYLSKKQALRIMPEEAPTNKWGVSYAKFWFSLESGYLGFTGTGNALINFDAWSKGKSEEIKKETFTQEELDYIKNELGIKTGILTPVVDYSKLQLGDDVVGYFSKTKDKAFLTKAKIWIDEKYIKAIQDVAVGKDPKKETVGKYSWKDWGKHSWGLGRADKVAQDHLLLHLYKDDKEPIRLGNKRTENPLDFNLPMKQNGTIGNWKDNWSIHGFKTIDQADFAIVVYIDKMTKTVPSVNAMRSSRIESRKGATKLMKDEDIKNINIKKYLTSMIANMGIKKNITELHNLQKVYSRSLCGDFALIAIYRDKPTTSYIRSFIDLIRKSMSVKGGSEAKLRDIISTFESLNIESADYQKRYEECYKAGMESGSDQQKELLQIIRGTGQKIKNYLKEQDIQTLDDLKIVYHRISSIRNFLQDPDFKISQELQYLIDEFHRPDRTRIHCREFREFDYTKDIRKLKNIERYVDSVLK